MTANDANTSRNGDELVVFDKVRKSYDGRVDVVENLDLSIRQGEFVTLLGPSGSGKTTTLMMLAGFEKPSGGEIYFAGAPLTDVPTYNRDFGMVFQNYALFPHMSVEENLAFPLRMHKFARAEIAPRVKRALDIVKLVAFAERKPGQLSGGQQQRVALARALVFEPRMVLMDEPLGALDKQLREHMQIEIKSIHDDLGLTILYVTHDQSEALTMSDRIAVFNNGRIQHIGPPKEVYNSPSNAFVASFMGENNSLDGEVLENGSGGLLVRTDAGGKPVKARSPQNLKAGDKVRILVRPERIGVVTSKAENRFRGNITRVIFHGDHVRLNVNVDGLGDLVSKLPLADGQREFAVGETITIGWSGEGTLAFATDGEQDA